MKTQNKTVLITGASTGIGFGAAKMFLEKGWNVVLNSRSIAKLQMALAELGHRSSVSVVPGNVGDSNTGEQMVQAALSKFGSVDVLVNNAGTFVPKPFLDVTEDELDHYLNGNLKGAYLTSQAAVRAMKKQGEGTIVNIGTVLVNHSSAEIPSSAPIVSKGGIHALTVSLASEFAADKIRVNAVAPGVIRTPIYTGSDVDALAGMQLLGRVGEVQDIVSAIFYLAEADFVTGVILPVDGGYTTGRSVEVSGIATTKAA